jgi:glutaminase
MPPDLQDSGQGSYVSTGRLPAARRVQALVAQAHELHCRNTDGSVSTVYPRLAEVSAQFFGVCVAETDGHLYEAGDTRVEFTIMSVAKPFVFALVCQALGPALSRARVGVNATGLPFNSLAAIESGPVGRTNPMVNAGAIVTTSLVPGDDLEQQWVFLARGLSGFAGRTLELDEAMYGSAASSNQRNRSMAWLLRSLGVLDGDPDDAVDLYTRQSCLGVTARDLAVMGATLADGGVNPLTGEQVVSSDTCRYTLAVMATAGLYEASGDWLYTIGLPGKSGIGGGIMTAAPGKGGLGTYAPRLDVFGNSVKGQLAARYLSRELGLNLFVSQPHGAPLPGG